MKREEVDYSEWSEAQIFKMSPAEAKAGFNDFEARLAAPVLKHVKERVKGDLDWHYHLGEMVAEVWRRQNGEENAEPRTRTRMAGDSSRNGRPTKYMKAGAKFVERLAVAVGHKSNRTLMNALRVYETWPRKSDFDAFAAMESEAGYKLTWTHMVHLSILSDPEERLQVAQECLENGWDAAELFNRLQASRKTAPGAGGRPPKLPKDFADAVAHIHVFGRTACRLFDESWMGKKFDLGKAFADVPPAFYSPDMRKDVAAAKDQLAALVEKASTAVAALTGMLEKVEAKLEGREPEADASAEEEDAEVAGI